MTTWCCLAPQRVEKSKVLMEPLSKGWPDAKICTGYPPGNDLFICYGQLWGVEKMIARALKEGRRFWQIDNGFYKAGRGSPNGYYRFMYCRPHPIFVEDDMLRARRLLDCCPFEPWRKDGRHIVVAEPGPDLGAGFGLRYDRWLDKTVARLKTLTTRPLKIRPRYGAGTTLQDDLTGAWALATHSSNVAVDAVLAGIPVFVAETSMCYPVSQPDWAKIEEPWLGNRFPWWGSLMCQQFTPAEMADGTAYFCLSKVAAQIEDQGLRWKMYSSSVQ